MHFSGFFYLLDRRGSFANENPFFLKRKRLIVEGIINLILRGRMYINTRGAQIIFFK